MTTQDGYDWPSQCTDEQWPREAAQPMAQEEWDALNDKIVEPFLRRLEAFLPSAAESLASAKRLNEMNKAAMTGKRDCHAGIGRLMVRIPGCDCDICKP